jgi:ketosteroid isomerase-like protein
MKALLFEEPLLLIPVLAVTLLVLAIVWSRRRTPGAWRALLAGLLAAPLLIIVQALVVTDREQIIRVCSQMADAVERGDVPAFAVHIADDFRAADGGGGAFTREDLLAALARSLARYHPEGVRLTGFQVTTDGDSGTAEFSATARIVTSETAMDRVLSRWRLRFRRNDRAWQVIDIQPVPTPFWPFRSLREIG